LNTEDCGAVTEVRGFGGGDVTVGVEKSKRSFMPELVIGGEVGNGRAVSNAPNPLEELIVLELAY
jgi:hypothetical protein